jgi:hypothetical protein
MEDAMTPTARPLMLRPSQWQQFQAAGYDMSQFGRTELAWTFQTGADTPAAETGGQSKPTADLSKLKKYFTEWQSLTREGRTESIVDIDYYDSKQLTVDEKQVLSKRGQPDIVFNRIKPAINGILGVVERGKSEPRAFPRDPGDDDASEVATDSLRYVADYNRFPQLKSRSFKDMLVPGTMARRSSLTPT